MKKAYSKQHLMRLHKLVPKVKCFICGTTENLVWDHNHQTNKIRGVLCSLCNSWLAIYESEMKKAFFLKEWLQYYLWVYYYLDKIKFHLNHSTGVNYSDKPSFIKKCLH